MAAKLKLITVLIGFLWDLKWREPGEVLEIDAHRADVLAKKTPPLVAYGEHVIEVDANGEPTEPKAGSVFDPPEFPGAEQLAAAGITNFDQLGELMKTKGDAWFTGITGIGKKSAALIAAAFEKLNAEI